MYRNSIFTIMNNSTDVDIIFFSVKIDFGYVNEVSVLIAVSPDYGSSLKVSNSFRNRSFTCVQVLGYTVKIQEQVLKVQNYLTPL